MTGPTTGSHARQAIVVRGSAATTGGDRGFAIAVATDVRCGGDGCGFVFFMTPECFR
jgi:hypothetical protein